MYYLGIDVGTTTLSAAVTDETGRVVHAETQPGPGFIDSPDTWARLQDAEKIVSQARSLIDRLKEDYSIAAIGLTGQMHGVVPVDENGRAVGPLYTWQDGRGSLSEGGKLFSEVLSREIGLPLSSGYGLVTHAYNLRHGLADKRTRKLTTAAGYLGMCLTGRQLPLLHASDAASLGGFHADKGFFDEDAQSAAEGALPHVTDEADCLGVTADEIPVSVAIGDNQASFLGTVGEEKGSLLVNIGTGSQVSVCADDYVRRDDFDTRPFIDGKYLLAVSPLCGGRSYALLEKFMRACAEMAGVRADGPLYEAMNALAAEKPADPLTMDTRFCGTRAEPTRRGALYGLNEDNFTPAHVVYATLEGMARELFEGYAAMKPYLKRYPAVLSASGNAVKKNPALQRILSDMFELPLVLSPYEEEAARGAALFAMKMNAQKEC